MESMKITLILFLPYIMIASNPLSIPVSALFGLYIMCMLYFNIIKPNYNGSWSAYIASILRGVKNRVAKFLGFFKKNKNGKNTKS